MKKLFIMLLTVISVSAYSQVKISQMADLVGICDTCHIPVVKGNQNFKAKGYQLIDTSGKWIVNIWRVPGKDSLFFQIGGTVYAIKDSSGGSGTVTNVSRTNGYGISASVSNPTTTPDITIGIDSATVYSYMRSNFIINQWNALQPESRFYVKTFTVDSIPIFRSHLHPLNDNANDLGTTNKRWATVHTGNIRNLSAINFNISGTVRAAVSGSGNLIVGSGTDDASGRRLQVTGRSSFSDTAFLFGKIIAPNISTVSGTSDSAYVLNRGTGEVEYKKITTGGSFTLTNGSGTTANSSAVDLGGTMTSAATINGNKSYGTLFSMSPAFNVTDTFGNNRLQLNGTTGSSLTSYLQSGNRSGQYSRLILYPDSIWLETSSTNGNVFINKLNHGTTSTSKMTLYDTVSKKMITYKNPWDTLDAVLDSISKTLKFKQAATGVQLAKSVAYDTLQLKNAQDSTDTWGIKFFNRGDSAIKAAVHTVTGEWILACSDETTAITTGTAKLTFRTPFACTVTAVRASVNTVSSSGNPTFDINEAGTTILSTKLSIDASEKSSTTAATAAVISDASLADDAEITIDFDTAGTGAKGVKIIIYYKRTL